MRLKSDFSRPPDMLRERETFSAMFVFVIVVVLGIGKGDSYIRIQI